VENQTAAAHTAKPAARTNKFLFVLIGLSPFCGFAVLAYMLFIGRKAVSNTKDLKKGGVCGKNSG